MFENNDVIVIKRSKRHRIILNNKIFQISKIFWRKLEAELALALKGLYNVETNLKFDKLIELSKLVERLSNIKVSTMKPVVGDMIFTRESGLVVAQMINHPPSVEGYSPELLGRKRSVALDKKSGKKSIEYVLNELDINLSEDKIDLVLEKVKT